MQNFCTSAAAQLVGENILGNPHSRTLNLNMSKERTVFAQHQIGEEDLDWKEKCISSTNENYEFKCVVQKNMLVNYLIHWYLSQHPIDFPKTLRQPHFWSKVNVGLIFGGKRYHELPTPATYVSFSIYLKNMKAKYA